MSPKIFLPGLIVLPLLAACSQPKPDARGLDRDETLLSLSASGEAEAVPDLATITIGVETFGADARGANDANSKKAAAVAKALSAFGVTERDMQTANLSLNLVDYGPRKGQYRANNMLTVRLHDVLKAGEAVAAATVAGANILSGPQLIIDDPEKANRGAYIAAYRAAHTRAEAYAEAAGMKIARVLTIRDGGQGGGMVPYEAMDASSSMRPQAVSAPAPPPSVSMRPGVTRTRVSVQVDFALEAK